MYVPSMKPYDSPLSFCLLFARDVHLQQYYRCLCRHGRKDVNKNHRPFQRGRKNAVVDIAIKGLPLKFFWRILTSTHSYSPLERSIESVSHWRGTTNLIKKVSDSWSIPIRQTMCGLSGLSQHFIFKLKNAWRKFLSVKLSRHQNCTLRLLMNSSKNFFSWFCTLDEEQILSRNYRNEIGI